MIYFLDPPVLDFDFTQLAEMAELGFTEPGRALQGWDGMGWGSGSVMLK